MATQQTAYFGLGFVVTLILAIIYPTNWICGFITRIQRKNYLMAVLQFFFCFVFYWIDLISIIVNKDLKWLAESKD